MTDERQTEGRNDYESDKTGQSNGSPPPGNIRNRGIRLLGVGGAGVNAVERLAGSDLGDVEPIAVNTDEQALSACAVPETMLVGQSITRGLSAGGDPEIGRQVAETCRAVFDARMQDGEVVVIITGLGGGTGGPVACAAAEAANRAGALVVAFAVLPFSFEGSRRQKQAEEALVALRRCCDAVIPLANDLLLQQMGEKTPIFDVFRLSDEWIARGVRSLWGILNRPGQINLDLADLRRVFRQKGGKTLYGLGSGSGERCAEAAFKDLLLCPLLHSPEFSSRADHLLVSVSAGPEFTMTDFHDLVNRVRERFGRDGHLAMGLAVDEAISGKIDVCVLGSTEIDSERSGNVRRQSRDRPMTPAPARGNNAGGNDQGGVQAVKSRARQREFGFEEGDRRGFFDRSESNVYEGEDLDVPTYLRRGIRISI